MRTAQGGDVVARGGFVWLLLSLLLSACNLLRAPLWPMPTLSAGVHSRVLRVQGRDRSYLLYVPKKPHVHAPLVVLLHGSRQRGEDLRRVTGYAFDKLADQHGFVAVYPDAFGGRWNDCRAGRRFAARTLQIDDVGFLAALVKKLEQTAGIDPKRVFMAGYSGGAQLAFRVALEQPGRVAGIAAFSASLPTPQHLLCTPVGKPVPALLVNGTRDRINPFAGGRVSIFGFANRGHVRSARDSAAYFAELAGVSTFDSRVLAESRETWIEQFRWYRQGAAEVILLAVHGGGHVVPGPNAAFPRIVGKVSRVLDGPREAWDFFSRQPSREQ